MDLNGILHVLVKPNLLHKVFNKGTHIMFRKSNNYLPFFRQHVGVNTSFVSFLAAFILSRSTISVKADGLTKVVSIFACASKGGHFVSFVCNTTLHYS